MKNPIDLESDSMIKLAPMQGNQNRANSNKMSATFEKIPASHGLTQSSSNHHNVLKAVKGFLQR